MNSLQPSAFNLAPPPTLQWQPVRSANFLAICGRSYTVNTTSAAITVTLPLNPNPGDQIMLTDYAGTWDTNNLTINPNGNKLNGSGLNGVVSTERGSVNLVYIDSTQGWISYASNLSTSIAQGITATGGNEIKTVGSYKYHIFTASGTFTISAFAPGVTFEVMSCGGGGGGGGNLAGGGGGGELDLFTSVTASASAYTVTVGGKGTGGTLRNTGATGGTSSFALSPTTYVSSLGGGGGGGDDKNGAAGGSGGGAGGGGSNTAGGASGSNTNVGGEDGTPASPIFGAGGGGGATAAGGAGSTAGSGTGGSGGEGYTLTNIDSNFTSANFTSFSGMTVICSGGGGGVLKVGGSGTTRGVGGTGAGSGGQNDGTTNTASATAATSFGSGGGGGGWDGGSPNNAAGGNAYDGVVIVRYLA